MKQWKRRLKQAVSGTLAAVLLLGLLPGLPGLTPTAYAAESDPYGFELGTPHDFDANDQKNPYGSAAVTGHVNFNPVKELGIFESAAGYQISTALNIDRSGKFNEIIPTDRGDNHYKNNHALLTGALPGNSLNYFQRSFDSYLNYAQGVAYDPTGSGKDDHIVYYGYGGRKYSVDKNRENCPGFIEFDARQSNASTKIHYINTDKTRYGWMDAMESWKADGYNALVAGDFNGNGKDTIIVYNPALGNLQLQEYVNVNESAKTSINIGGSSDLRKYFNDLTLNDIQQFDVNNNGYTCRNTPMVHLTAGDLDGDGDEELVVTISLGDNAGGDDGQNRLGGNSYTETDKYSTASVVMVYNQRKNDTWELAYHTQLANVYDASVQNNKSYKGWFMRSAASAIGDFDGDGNPEIVTAGLPADDKRHNDDDLNRAAMLLTLIQCGGGTYSIEMTEHPGNEAYIPKTVPMGWYIKNETNTGFGDWANVRSSYADNPPLSIGAVQLEGTGTTPYLFLQGHIFQFDGNIFTAAKNVGDTGQNKNLDKYLENMTYVGQPVIANFDGNTQGRQQVFFVVGQRGTGKSLNGATKDKNWIIGLAFDPAKGTVMDGTGLYSSDWDTNVIDRYNDHATNVVLTAPDIDTDDGMLAHYKSKQYTYADPEIMAILAASPYFEDLVEEYPDTSGSTAFGTGKGSSSGSTQTSNTRAGAYISFEQEASVLGFKLAKAEMEVAYEAEWGKEVSKETSWDYTMTFETGRSYNQVLLIRTPVIVYNYEVVGPSGIKSEMSITTAQKPVYCLIPIDQYNEIARQRGDDVIGTDVIDSVPGQPDTYPTEMDMKRLADKNVKYTSNWIDAGGGGNSVVTQEITKTTSEGLTTSLTHSFDAKGGAGVGGFVIGVSGGFSEGKAKSVTNTESVTRAGTVSSVPDGYSDSYGFKWQFMTWDATFGKGEDSYTVPVLSYVVKDVKQPPSLPVNIEAVPETDSITLSWEPGFNSAEKYEIARYLPNENSYTTIGTVMGNEAVDGRYTFECTGLTPGFAYHYALRAISGDLYSAYTEPLTVVTASEGGGLPVIYEQPTSQQIRPGQTAGFNITAVSGDGTSSVSYQWQVRKVGRLAWENLPNTNRDRITLSNVSKDMDGYEYRCQVSQLSNTSENRVFIYSEPATLSVGKSSSTTGLTLSKNGGTAAYTEDTTDAQTVTKTYRVDSGDAAGSYQAYSSGSTTYYYCVDDGKYYLLTSLSATGEADAAGVVAATATGRTELTNLQNTLTSGGKKIAGLNDLHSTVQATETIDGVEYNVFAAQGVAVTTDKDGKPIYDLTESALTLYQKQESEDKAFYVEADAYDQNGDLSTGLKKVEQAASGGTLQNLTYSGTPEPMWSDTYASEDGYDVMTFGDGSTKLYRKDGVYYTRTEPSEEGGTSTYTALTLNSESTDSTILGAVGTDGTISSQITHNADAAAETTQVSTTTQIPQDGQSVTLTAQVSAGTGRVTFKIVNTTTGTVQNVDATLSGNKATAEWTPSTAGVYQITASYQGDSNTMPSSSAPATYYAYVNPAANTGYKLRLAESISYGEAVNPQLVKWTETNGSITESTEGAGNVSYAAYKFLGIGESDADEAGYSKTAVSGWSSGQTLVPGDYLIRASWSDETISAQLTVNRRAITVTAPTIAGLSLEAAKDFNLADHLKDIVIDGNAILSADETVYGGKSNGYPNLFRLAGGPRTAAGSYDIRVDYAVNGSAPTDTQKNAYADFQAKYLPTLQKSTVSVTADTVTVTYTHGANGDLTAAANSVRFSSGDAVNNGSKLVFTATPDPGFSVSRWTIDGAEVTAATSGVTLLPAQNALIVNSVNKSMTVGVEFSNQSYKITFGASDAGHGSVSAQTDTGLIGTGGNVVGGHSVTFTAKPDTGYIVQKWTVNNVDRKNDDGTLYSGSSLTLENISGNTTVTVTFEQSVEYTVTFTAVDSKTLKEVTAGVTLSNQGLNSQNKAVKGSTVTLTAAPAPGNAILEWQMKGTNGKWSRVADSSTDYTIQSLQGNTEIRVLVNTQAVTYPVNFGVYDMNTPSTAVENGGTLSATINGTVISNNSNQPNGSRIVFTLAESDDYELDHWLVNDREAGTGKTCTVESLIESVTVKAVVRQKPTVSFGVYVENELDNAVENGGTLSATINGTAISSGSRQSSGSRVTFTLTESNDYEFVCWNVNGSEITGGKTYSVDSLSGETTVKAVVRKKPKVEITPPEHGTVSVSYTLNGAPVEAQNGYIYTGTVIRVELIPDTGYVVDQLQGFTLSEELATTDNRSGTMTANTSGATIQIAPTFKALEKHTVTFSVVDTGTGGHGSLTVSATRKGMAAYQVENMTSGAEITEGSTLTFSAAPDTGYRVQEWTVDGEKQVNDAGQTVIASPLKLENLNSDTQVSIQYVAVGNQVIVRAFEHGTVTAAKVAGTDVLNNIDTGFTLSANATVEITVEPDPGYEVAYWNVNAQTEEGQNGNTFTYTAQSDQAGATIVAHFQQVEYPVAWSADHGSVTAEEYSGTSANIRGGTTVSFTAAPENGYVFSHWAVNGETISGADSASLTWTVPNGKAAEPPVERYDIQAVFARSQEKFTVTCAAESGGTVSLSGGGSSTEVTYGDSITFTAVPNQYYYVSGWKVNGTMVEGTANRTSYTLENVTADTTVTVCFATGVSYNVSYAVTGNFYSTLTATANGSPLTLTAGQTTPVAGGSRLVFTAHPSAGGSNPQHNPRMVKSWKIGGTIVEGNISNTLTIDALSENVNITIELEDYEGVEIPKGNDGYEITNVRRDPAETYEGAPEGEIRKGGTVTFTVKTTGDDSQSKFDTLTVNGYDCINGSGTVENCEKVTAVRNADGSYTVTVVGVTGAIATDIKAHQLHIGELTVPEALKNNEELNSTDKIQAKLDTKLTNTGNNKVYYDIALKYWKSDANSWVEVTQDNFPTSGVDVVLPYPNGASSGDRFTIVHMLTADSNAGTVEVVNHTNQSDGLHFHVNSLSPFAVSWSTPHSVTVTGGSGSGEYVANETVSITATVPSGKQFTGWTVTQGSVSLVDSKSATTTFTMPDTNVAITANFEAKPGGNGGGGSGGGGGGGGTVSESYNITVAESAHGKVSTDLQTAAKGDKVLLTVQPQNGYVLDTLTVTDSRGNEIKLTAQSDGKYTFTMPDRDVTVKAVFKDSGSQPCDGGADCPSHGFTDLGGVDAWYHDAVDYALKNGLMSGYGNQVFGPNNHLSRAMLAQILYNKEGRPAVTDGSAFTDVADSRWYASAVTWAAENGIVSGYGNGRFGPNDNITREQLAVMLWRYAGRPAATGKELHFADADKASSYALESLCWAVDEGIITGKGNGILDPGGNATRAEVAAMLMRYLDKKD